MHHGLILAFVSVDDFLIALKYEKEHRKHLGLVLRCFQEHGVYISISKCILCASSIKFLGHRADCEYTGPLLRTVNADSYYPEP